jgi:hypothetical protein
VNRRRPLDQLNKNQQQSENRRRELIRQMQRSSAKTLSSPSTKADPPLIPKPASTKAAPAFLSARVSDGKFRFADEQGRSGLTADIGLTSLANEMLDAASSSDIRLVMLWPGLPDVLPLAHAVATMQRWDAGDKIGIRSLWYPVLTNSLIPLQRYFVEPEYLNDMTRKLVETGSERNTFVERSCPGKDSIFFSITAATELIGQQGAMPSIAEVVPHFLSRPGKVEWTPFGDRYANRLRRGLADTRRSALIKAATELGTIDSAPDSIFAISHLQSVKGIRSALAALHRAQRPLDIVVIPLIYRLRRAMPTWFRDVARFIRLTRQEFKATAPGIVILTDEPLTYERIKRWLPTKMADRNSKSAVPLKSTAILWPNSGEGLRPAKWAPGRTPEPRNIDVQVCDKEGADVVHRVDKILNDRELPDESITALKETRGFLCALSSMCATRLDLQEWIEASSDRVDAAATYTWLPYENLLRELAEHGRFGDARPEVESIIHSSKALWALSERGLPMAQLVWQYVSEHANRSTRTLIVFSPPREVDLARRFLQGFEFGDGKQFSDLQERIKLDVAWNLDTLLRDFQPRRLLLVGAFRAALAVALTRNNLPAEIKILLNHPAAEYLARALGVAMGEAALRTMRPRMQTILSRVGEELTKRDRMKSWLQEPEAILRLGVSGPGRTESVYDRDAYVVALENGVQLSLSPETILYRYQPQFGVRTENCFAPILVRKVVVGDSILVASAELRAALDDTLRAHGHQGVGKLPQEAFVAYYHKELQERLDKRFGKASIAEIDRKIRTLMQADDPKAAFPLSVRYWIAEGESFTRDAEQRPPRGPRRQEHYDMFARVLGFTEREARFYWANICAVRIGHQIDGRKAANRWESLLLDATEFLVTTGVTAAEIQNLLRLALEHVELVIEVNAPGAAT